MRRLWIVTLLAAGAVPSPALAQSFYGPGGLFLHPAATVQAEGEWTPAVLVLPQRSMWTGDDRRTWFTGSLTYGATEDLEVGIAGVGVEGWGRDPSYGGFAKFRLLREDDSRPAVAVGMTHLGGGDLDTSLAFLAFRKQVGSSRGGPIVAHVGTQFAIRVDDIKHYTWDPYAGIEAGLGSGLSFIAEGRPGTMHYKGTPLALTLAYQVNPSWRLALTWANPGHSDVPHWGFGAGFTLGSR